jgi:hypothetical protein
MTKRNLLLLLLSLSPLGRAEVGVRPILGVTDTAPAKWDGSVASSRGRVTRIDPWRFEQEEAIVGDSAWKASTVASGCFSGLPQVERRPLSPYDTHRKDARRYRDYVIRAFQNEKPYDRLLTEQLAGDEIAPKEDETLIAAGFNRLGPYRKNAGNQEIADSRNEVLTEMDDQRGGLLAPRSHARMRALP